ncbi:DUF5329 family protein [Thalassotalea agarivorans]|uniref:Uncharacterized protein n=1 Tax=Thalassotalea agarivorans TaxID=349064 RepID=A0A1I0CT59_THASX|nr:DUF5329 family protein [Thalassotalea agarivorans]SET22858.1 hypothetical protein SAMN05660429_01318 [Thalassotalea agarivorans]
MKKLVYAALVLFSAVSIADTQAEINYLLAQVSSSNCKFERNGKKYEAKDAVKHIKKKYDYFEADIETAEDFIKLSATKSTMSGKYYMMHCPSQKPVKSEQWLLSKLADYRAL